MADFFWPIGDRIDGVPLYTYVNQDQRILSNMYFRKSTTISKILKIKQCKQFQKQILLFQRMGRENKHNNMGLCPLDFLL